MARLSSAKMEKMKKIDQTKETKKVQKNFQKKAQIFSADLVIALMVFLAILIFIFGVHQYAMDKTYAEDFDDEMQVRQIADLLASTPGSPANWSSNSIVNSTFVNSIGLIDNCLDTADCARISHPSGKNSGKGTISLAKLSKFNTSYSGASGVLGMQPYNFRADLYLFNGTGYVMNFSAFRDQSYGESSNTYVVTREVVVDGKPARFIFYAWRK